MPFGVPRADDNTTSEWKLDDIELLIPGEVVATIPVPDEIDSFAYGRVSFFAVLTHARPAWLLIAAAVLILSAVLWSDVGKRYAIRFGIDADKHRRWKLIGLLLGPAGILAMVTAHYCPSRVRCSQCHRLRVVTQELCEHCGAKFAEPKMNGTEILAGAST